MEISHLQDCSNTKVTFQLLRVACPKCKEAVEFILSGEDRLYKEDAEYLRKRCENQSKEIVRLNEVIDKIIASPQS